MSGEVVLPEEAPGDLVALGVRVDGKVTKYSWPLDPAEGLVVETTPRYLAVPLYAGHLVGEKPVGTDVVIRFRTTA